MDPQGHCAVGLAVPEEQIERTVFDALIEERDGKPVRLADTVWQIATDFDLAPSNIKLAGFEQLFAGRHWARGSAEQGDRAAVKSIIAGALSTARRA